MSGLKRRLLGQYGIIIAVTVAVLEMIFLFTMHEYYYGTVEQVERQRVTLTASLYNRFAEGTGLADKGRSLIDNISANEGAEVQVIDWSGKVVISSRGFVPQELVKTSDFRAAMNGTIGTWVGRDPMTDERVLAVASPLQGGERTIGVLRYVVSVEEVDRAMAMTSTYSIVVGILVIGLSMLFSLPLAKSIINPAQDLTRAADRMAAGHYDVRAQLGSNDELGQLAEAFNHMADEIVQADKMKNDFIASISHELRTPLTSIKGWGETIAYSSLEDQDQTRQGLQIICQETERMIRLVEELLDFSRFRSGRVQLHKERAEANQLVKQAANQMAVRAKQKQVTLALDLDPGLGMISIDTDRLRQVLINLLDNALNFTPQHGAITVQTRCSDDKMVIRVMDTGDGISSDDLPNVTKKFYKGTSRQAGSGLGLSIVAEIVQLHGGELQVESELGQGTSATVLLPLAVSP